jgi:hypothetical protein
VFRVDAPPVTAQLPLLSSLTSPSVYTGEGLRSASAGLFRLSGQGHRQLGEWVFRGRHVGSLMGEPPGGRQVEIPMAAVDEVESSEITWARLHYAATTATRQLGLESAAARS